MASLPSSSRGNITPVVPSGEGAAAQARPCLCRPGHRPQVHRRRLGVRLKRELVLTPGMRVSLPRKRSRPCSFQISPAKRRNAWRRSREPRARTGPGRRRTGGPGAWDLGAGLPWGWDGRCVGVLAALGAQVWGQSRLRWSPQAAPGPRGVLSTKPSRRQEKAVWKLRCQCAHSRARSMPVKGGLPAGPCLPREEGSHAGAA